MLILQNGELHGVVAFLVPEVSDCLETAFCTLIESDFCVTLEKGVLLPYSNSLGDRAVLVVLRLLGAALVLKHCQL